MDAQIESLIELYLTRGGKVFISPQYDVRHDEVRGEGGACPDIVALDMQEKEVVVVEVSSAASLTSLYERIEQRHSRWFSPIMRRMREDNILHADWNVVRFLGFVRRDNLKGARSRFSGQKGVSFFAIEEVAFTFAYWTSRENNGLHRDYPKEPYTKSTEL
jgi:hypothetical protein